MNRVRVIGLLLYDAANGWSEHRAPRLAAALAFYTTLALAPLMLIAIAIAGSFFGEEAARGEIVHQIEYLVGRPGAETIEALILKASEPQHSRWAAAISVALLLYGATGVFAELKDSLDTVWGVKPKPGVVLWTMVKTRALAFAVMLGTGFLLLVSLVLTTALTAIANWLGRWMTVGIVTAQLCDVLASFVVITLLFAMIFKLLPDVTVHWKDVWIGAVLTALLFMVGKHLIGIYLGSASITSIYGAAGSLVVLLLWMYYSSLILFFGAELARAYAGRCDPEPVLPTEQGVTMTKAELATQGMPAKEDLDRAVAKQTSE